MADGNNDSENGKKAQGPLAKVVRAGAKPGIPEKHKLPAIPDAANAEPKVEQPINVGEETKGNMKSFVKTLLASENVDARVKGLKLADHFATPEMAADIALAANIRIYEHYNGQWRWRKNNNIRNLANKLVEKLFNDDPKTTVDSLLKIYLETKQVKCGDEGDVEPFESELADHKDVIQALWNDRGIKHPELLRFAEERLKKPEVILVDINETLQIIQTLGLPEGIDLLEKIANSYTVKDITKEFLDACEAVSIPECIPILIAITEKVEAEHYPRIADLTAKILDINLD